MLNLPPFAEKRDALPDALPPRPDLTPKKATDPKNVDPAPEPRPLPGTGGAVRPAPGLPLGAPRPQSVGGPDNTFAPDGRVALPPLPPGDRPVGVIAPPPPLTGTAGSPDAFFKPDGRVALPPLPPGTPAGTPAVAPPAPGGTGRNPEDYFKPNGRVALPPPPKRPAEPVWGRPGTVPAPAPAPAPSAGATGFDAPPTVAPLPPIIPPTLPPVSGAPGG